MAEIYSLDKYRRTRVDHSSTSVTGDDYQSMAAGEVMRPPRPLAQGYSGAGKERTKYLSEGEDFELSPDLLIDHSWRETKRRTAFETVAEFGVPRNLKWELMLELFRNEMYEHAETVAERLEHLNQLEPEEDEQPISLDSMATFLSFLVAFSGKVEPGITVTPDGNIYATWKAEGGRHCGIEFAPSRAAKLVLMLPPEEPDTGSGVHVAGMMGAVDLERTLRLYRIHAW